MTRMIGTRKRQRRRPCRRTSTSSSTATGCGSRDARQRASSPRPPLVTFRRYVWWVGWRAWSSGGACTRTWRGRRSSRRCPTCTSSNWASSPCGRTPPMSMEGNGLYDYVKHRRVARGRTCAWRCWASSSWSARSSAGSCSPCDSRTTTLRCGTARRRTRRRRRACGTRCAASCSCRPPCPSSTRRTATVCERRPAARRPRTWPRPTRPPPSKHRSKEQSAAPSCPTISTDIVLTFRSGRVDSGAPFTPPLRPSKTILVTV